MPLPDELANLDDCEPMSGLREVSDSCTIVGRCPSYWQAARWCSTFLPGQWYWKDRGITWSCGRRTHWFVREEDVQAILDSRAACALLGVEPGWSVGSCARGLLDLLPRHQYPYKGNERMMPLKGIGYQSCEPGLYPRVWHWDVSAYYFTLLSRLPSLWPHRVGPGRIVWGTWYPSERRTWDAILAAVGRVKSLRNALVGCCAGRARGTEYFCRGERRQWKGSAGPYRGAAVAIWRAGWEITACQVEASDAVYAATDAIITEHPGVPEVWAALGFTTRLEHAGEGDVCSPGLYRIGDYETGWYARGSRLRDRYPRPVEWRGESYCGWVMSAA